ncbi:hypothetical protein M7I_0123 [Glarea lozoyensis 74030]|uniref:Uncharacterized protein n=1 Tax=Glarea lozoyensis (strain ATCC 74030 / MF5533) TaxID=1104152 RepID=H0ECI5_GLAL7|nr:hypothetical protein M7I_0123 [Glarea lozoyensis 74030]
MIPPVRIVWGVYYYILRFRCDTTMQGYEPVQQLNSS